jgi:ligand-binding sensor domain-containing protein
MKTYPDHILFVLLLALSVDACDDITPPSEHRGPQWLLYTKANSPLVGDTINALSSSFGGALLIATTNGANSVNQGQWLVFSDTLVFNTPLGPSRNVLCAVTARDKSIWFGLAGGGVKRFNPQSQNGEHWVSYNAPVINTDFVYSVTADPSGSVWIGTSSGLTRFIQSTADPTKGTWLKYTSGNSPIPDEQIRSAGVNPNDNIVWFGTQNHGVVSFDGDLVWGIDQPSDAPFPIVSMAFGTLNDIWFGTYADWAYRYILKTYEWDHYVDTAWFKNNFVNAVAVAPNGSVWFGTNDGLVRLQSGTWTTFTKTNSQLPSDTIKALAIDPRGNLWIGTPKGLAEYNPDGTK